MASNFTDYLGINIINPHYLPDLQRAGIESMPGYAKGPCEIQGNTLGTLYNLAQGWNGDFWKADLVSIEAFYDDEKLHEVQTLDKAFEIYHKLQGMEMCGARWDVEFIGEHLRDYGRVPDNVAAVVYLAENPLWSQSWNMGRWAVENDLLDLPEGFSVEWLDYEAIGRDLLLNYNQTESYAFQCED